MPKNVAGTITLEANTVGNGEQTKEFLTARFEPPLPQGTNYRKEVDGYYPCKVINDDEGTIKALVYERGLFGWSPKEREVGFVQYWQDQEQRLGYVAAGPLVEQYGEAPSVRRAR